MSDVRSRVRLQLRPVVAALLAWAALWTGVPAPLGAQAATPGALVIPAGTTQPRSVVVLSGDVDVQGQVQGDVVSVFGDITVRPGARVTGSARSVFGRARSAGGRVDGRVQTGWRTADVRAAPSRPYDPWAAVRVTLAWFGVLAVLGLGLLAGAGTQLDAVAAALEDSPGRAVLAGLAGELALAPALVVLVAALAVTVVGVLAVPLAVVAFVLSAAGLLTLGFLAAAFVIGRWASGGRPAASGRPRATAVRAASLRALAVGIAIFAAVWTVAALLGGGTAAAGLLVRAAALALTWLAVTAGFGAALRSRAGTRADRAPAAASAGEGRGVPVWQTPTPVAGVVAARRPSTVSAPRPTAGTGAGAE